MNDDAVLLRRYAEEGSESAFSELVRRHVDLVYAAARRRTGGDPHRAADVAQQVFATLARDARKLSRHAVLGAWLHTATRNAALNLMISEQRRQVREHEALALDPVADTGAANPDWERLRPVLDNAIDELPEADRAAVVLRFLERRPFAEIGVALRVSEDAARMRTERALEKLRSVLARRGITSTAAALGAIVSSQPLVSAPAGLAATLASAAFTAAGSGAGILGPIALFMSTKIVTTTAITAVVFFGLGAYVGSGQNVAPPPPIAATPETSPVSPAVAAMSESNQSLKAEVDRLKTEIERLDAVNGQLIAQRVASPPVATASPTRGPTIGLAKWEVQQAALANLRQIDAARKQHVLEKGKAAGGITELVGRGGYIKTVRTVDGEDYSKLSMDPADPMTVTTPDGTTITFDPTGATTTRPEIPPEVSAVRELSARVLPSSTKALAAYRSAHNGANPPNEEAVVPYFTTPQEAADFAEFIKAKRAAGL